jgi:hypothetical protein
MNKALLGVIAAFAVVQASVALACSSDGKIGIAPENDLYIPVSKFAVYTITEEEFDAANEKAQEYYAPVFEAAGREYQLIADWEDGTVNAYANRSGNVSEVHMFGGLARHPKMTKDGYMLVICHETGHHIGGAPRKGISWASNEGQSDYYATISCARHMWADEDNESVVASMDVPGIVTERCEAAFTDSSEIAICQRAAMAGKDLGDTLGDLGRTGDTDFNTPDTNVATRTDDNHPKAQCRTDTYFAGAVCAKDVGDVMPDDAKVGACNATDGETLGSRPLCWYNPNTGTGGGDGGGSSWPTLGMRKRASSR